MPHKRKYITDKELDRIEAHERRKQMRMALRQAVFLTHERRVMYPETAEKLHLYFSLGSVN